MEELKKWLLDKIDAPFERHNQFTYIWSKGYRKALRDVLEFIISRRY